MCISTHVPYPDDFSIDPTNAVPHQRNPHGLREVVEQTVARVFDVDLDHMRLPTRGRANVAKARQVAMYLTHVACGLSLTETGEVFHRDRTTVAHACRVVEDGREDQEFDQAIELLEMVTRVLAAQPA